MKIAIALFDRFTALDAVGPYEVLSRLPGAEVTFVGEREGVFRTDVGSLGIEVGATFAALADPDVMLVPGGPGVDEMVSNVPLRAWIQRAHRTSTWTASVCTGSLVLGAAGLLEGLRATTHWLQREALARYGATPSKERVIFEGKIVTGAGVSAGIDLALALAGRIAGETVAQAIQLGIEYDPEPPFAAGSAEKAPPAVVELLRERARSRFQARG
jgi:transcriptional regulator GlxA family with amidase domain